MDVINQGNSLNNSNKSMSRRKMHEFFINDNSKNLLQFKHKPNRINTTKYNIFTFLPKSLLFEFFRLANCYFLLIAIVQSIKTISPLSPLTAIAPLAFVLSVSILREAVEDYSRHRYDSVLNGESVIVFRDGGFVEASSGDLKIGEIVLIRDNSAFPADMILLDSNLHEGMCYVETGTLDGERTLKHKIAQKSTAGFFNNGGSWKNSFLVEGKCICDTANPDLYKLEGNLELSLNDMDTNVSKKLKIPIESKQMLLKGAFLRNTEWAIGFIVYTGHSTKLILNSKKQRVKFSRVETLLSKLLLAILFLQFIFCVICAICHGKYHESYVILNPYIPPTGDSNFTDNLISYFSYMLLLNTMIPISLIITLEVVKVIQGIFTSFDVELYSHVRQKFAKAGSISINEELGQVNFIFSDKTGTLTCNKMIFKYCVIGDMCYEYQKDIDDTPKGKKIITNINEEETKLRDEMNIKTIGPRYMQRFFRSKSMAINRTRYKNFVVKSQINNKCQYDMQDEGIVIEEFWKALSLAHECSCNEKENGTMEYTGMSPDDIELVKTAAEQGYKYQKSSNSVRKVRINEGDFDFEVLNIMEFDSDRKRMSIIVRDGDQIKLYMKGADSEIKKRLSKESQNEFLEYSNYYVDYFSSKGFRTLFVALKIIDENEYNIWDSKLKKAELNLDNKKQAVKEAFEEIEEGVYLLGATIVEDKLQDEVPETIRDLRLAGIKIWMLTGDKMDTAQNIGLSCNLISRSLTTFKISGEKGDNLDKLIKEYSGFLNRIYSQNQSSIMEEPFAIVIDTFALARILKDKQETQLFLEVSSRASSVICCRVTPLQKAEVVKIMKQFDKSAVTLSIGDGGNDVSMIMEAHIGIGVYGEEGVRAVQASDFAIGEFKLLKRLLMTHGRTNYIRISEMILYFFFKNFTFTILHFFYAFINNASGQTIMEDWFISLYNMIFTAFPLGVRALLDHDITSDDGSIVRKMLPFLYKQTRDQPIFTKAKFIFSLFRGVVFALINFLVMYYSLYQSTIDSKGNTESLWLISVSIFTNIIFIVSFRLMVVLKYVTFINPLIMFVFSWLIYFCFVGYVHNSADYNSNGTMAVAFGSSNMYLNFLIVTVTCMLIDKFTYAVQINFGSSFSSQLMLLRNKFGKLDNMEDMSDGIRDCLKAYKVYENDMAKNQAPMVADYVEIKQKRSHDRESHSVDRIRAQENKIDVQREKEEPMTHPKKLTLKNAALSRKNSDGNKRYFFIIIFTV